MKIKPIPIEEKIRKLIISFFIILYKLLLDIVYHFYLSEVWEFMGFINNENGSNYIISWVILLLFIPLMLRNIYVKDISSLFLTLFNIIAFIPNLVVIGQYSYPNNYYLMLLIIYWFLLNVFNLILPKINIKQLKVNTNLVYYLIMTLFILIILYTSYKYTGFRIDLNIFNAYTYRNEASNYNMTSSLEYLFSISRNVFPVFIIERLCKKKYLQSFVLLFIGILAYSVTGSKSVLFSYVLVYFGYLFYKNKRIKYIPIAITILVLIAIFGILIFNKSYIIDVFIRRVFYMPGLLSYYYFDFFKDNPFDLFRQGIIGRLGFTSPYPIAIPQIIGNIYFLNAYANAGLFSDAYCNLGELGILFMPLLIIFVIRILEAVSVRINEKIIFAGSITMIFSLINSSFFTVLITHGMLIIIIIFYFIKRNNSSKEMEIKNERKRN